MIHGIKLVLEEREKQIKAGYSVEHDTKKNKDGQLLEAAKWLIKSTQTDLRKEAIDVLVPENWGVKTWSSMFEKKETERLAIAAALICAELDRCERVRIQQIEKEKHNQHRK